jgi:hypothetical protein
MKHMETYQKSIGKSSPAMFSFDSEDMDLENPRQKIREQKFWRLLPNVCNFQKENHTLRYGFQIYRKYIAYPMDFYSL